MKEIFSIGFVPAVSAFKSILPRSSMGICNVDGNSQFCFRLNQRQTRPSWYLEGTIGSTPDVSSSGVVGKTSPESRPDESTQWATYALLFSSLSDGVIPNPAARSFIRYSLVTVLLREQIAAKEDRLKTSEVDVSPNHGLKLDALDKVEVMNELSERGRKLYTHLFNKNKEVDRWVMETLDYLTADTGEDLNIRILYIPTAMYALNPQSSNTPGKQRQRARADGKKRRTQLLKLIEELLLICDGGDISVKNKQLNANLIGITLDLDDGSLKQPVGSDQTSSFPKDDRAALSTWYPHLVYIEGGNTFWLQHCIDKGNYAKLVKDACTGKFGAVYLGKSAGAIVAGKDVVTASWKGWDDPSIVPGRKTYDKWVKCKGFGFVGKYSFFPHMSDEWDNLLREKNDRSKGSDGQVLGLRDEDACCVLGEGHIVNVQSAPMLPK